MRYAFGVASTRFPALFTSCGNGGCGAGYVVDGALLSTSGSVSMGVSTPLSLSIGLVSIAVSSPPVSAGGLSEAVVPPHAAKENAQNERAARAKRGIVTSVEG